jgi:hypothetical protein
VRTYGTLRYTVWAVRTSKETHRYTEWAERRAFLSLQQAATAAIHVPYRFSYTPGHTDISHVTNKKASAKRTADTISWAVCTSPSLGEGQITPLPSPTSLLYRQADLLAGAGASTSDNMSGLTVAPGKRWQYKRLDAGNVSNCTANRVAELQGGTCFIK